LEPRSRRILIVDDDPASLALLSRHLRTAGYIVLTAENGVEAIQVLVNEGPQIVITDWTMPEMDGVELCRAIRGHEGITFAYVIIVTARQSVEDSLVEAFEAGADDYLCKPFNPRELLARLRAGERIVDLQQELDSRNREVHWYVAKMEITNARLGEVNAELNRMATTDELTGLTNRREAINRLAYYWSAAERHSTPLACVAMDLDHFKNCNDKYGHAAGDTVLRETAAVLQRSARQDELVCRIGGEEFLALCPQSTEEMAAVGAERLRRAVEANVTHHGEIAIRTTMSVGVAERTAEMETPDDLLRAADRALYAAKDAGRNTVCRASSIAESVSPVAFPR
jgi:diguanylate cyclase (GGDEF)-like protein